MASEPGKVAVVGPGAVVTPFRAVGLEVFPVEAGADPTAVVQNLINTGYQLIFFTDDLTERLQPLIEKFHNTALPCLVALPFTGTDAGEARLRAAVRRACGADVLGVRMGESYE